MRGLAKIISHVVTSPATRKLDLKDLQRQPVANDNLEFELIAEMLALGEAAPAALFLFPMWAAASAYLKDPHYYINKRLGQCGESPSQEKRRPLEWHPLLNPMLPQRQDYRNPQLTDAERQKLVEWLRPEKIRGKFTGAEGQPAAMPHDPPRDDSYGAPAEFRDGVMDVPRPNAMPSTEVALPDLQQSDDRRRLIMGDTIPGRNRTIGDFSDGASHDRVARDFLTPSHNSKSSDAQPSWLPDVRMQADFDRELPPSRRVTRLTGYGRLDKADSTPSNRPFLQLPAAYPKLRPKPSPKQLVVELNKVFAAMVDAWPRVDGQPNLLDIRALEHQVGMNVVIAFSDGQHRALRAVLIQHHQAVQDFNRYAHARKIDGVPAVAKSRDYLLWAMKFATGKTDIAIPNHSVPAAQFTVTLPKGGWSSVQAAEVVLKSVWQKRPELTDFRQVWVVNPKDGTRRRLSDMAMKYWTSLRLKLQRDGILPKAYIETFTTSRAMRLMWYHLFGAVRPDKADSEYHVLPFYPGQSHDTLEGIVRVAYDVFRLPFVQASHGVPTDYKWQHALFFQNGEVMGYKTFLQNLTMQLARAKMAGDPRVRQLVLDERYVEKARQDARLLAATAPIKRHKVYLQTYIVPDAAARTAMRTWVDAIRGEVPKPLKTVVRRGHDGTQLPVFANRHDDFVTGGLYAHELFHSDGVGVPRDAHGIMLGRSAIAHPESNPFVARQSDGGLPSFTVAISDGSYRKAWRRLMFRLSTEAARTKLETLVTRAIQYVDQKDPDAVQSVLDQWIGTLTALKKTPTAQVLSYDPQKDPTGQKAARLLMEITHDPKTDPLGFLLPHERRVWENPIAPQTPAGDLLQLMIARGDSDFGNYSYNDLALVHTQGLARTALDRLQNALQGNIAAVEPDHIQTLMRHAVDDPLEQLALLHWAGDVHMSASRGEWQAVPGYAAQLIADVESAGAVITGDVLGSIMNARDPRQDAESAAIRHYAAPGHHIHLVPVNIQDRFPQADMIIKDPTGRTERVEVKNYAHWDTEALKKLSAQLDHAVEQLGATGRLYPDSLPVVFIRLPVATSAPGIPLVVRAEIQHHLSHNFIRDLARVDVEVVGNSGRGNVFFESIVREGTTVVPEDKNSFAEVLAKSPVGQLLRQIVEKRPTVTDPRLVRAVDHYSALLSQPVMADAVIQLRRAAVGNLDGVNPHHMKVLMHRAANDPESHLSLLYWAAEMPGSGVSLKKWQLLLKSAFEVITNAEKLGVTVSGDVLQMMMNPEHSIIQPHSIQPRSKIASKIAAIQYYSRQAKEIHLPSLARQDQTRAVDMEVSDTAGDVSLVEVKNVGYRQPDDLAPLSRQLGYGAMRLAAYTPQTPTARQVIYLRVFVETPEPILPDSVREAVRAELNKPELHAITRIDVEVVAKGGDGDSRFESVMDSLIGVQK